MKIVLDASVPLALLLPNQDPALRADAERILRFSELEFVVPDSFWVEVTGVFAKSARQKRWSRADAVQAFEQVEAFSIETHPSGELIKPGLQLALAHQQSVYDTIYVALAIDHNLDLITADLRLYNALGALYPVRWLGGWIAGK